MKKLIKLMSLGCFIFVFVFQLFSINSNASFSENRFETNNLDELESIETDNITIYGSYFWYGKIKMDTYLYNKYDPQKDVMYYFVFADTGINGRGKIDHWKGWFKKQYYFNSYKMFISVDFSVINDSNVTGKLKEVNYYPYTTEKETNFAESYSYSRTIGADYSQSNGAGVSSSVSIGYSFSKSERYEDIEVKANSMTGPTSNDYSILYNFTQAKNKSSRVPYTGEVLRISSFVFSLRNYSKTIENNNLSLKITYDGHIYRAGSDYNDDCEIKKTIEHNYLIYNSGVIRNQNTDEQKYSYDVTNKKKLADLAKAA